MVSKPLVLTNANIITLDSEIPRASGVKVRNGKIARLYTDGTQLYDIRGCEILDCHKKTVLPGFIDAHCHFMALAKQCVLPDVSHRSINSIAALQRFLRETARRTPPGRWVQARGLQPYNLMEKRYPQRHELDAVSVAHPICITDASGYVMVLNSTALELVNITYVTQPPSDAVIELDLESGLPDGVLYGMQDYLRRFIPGIEEQDLVKGIKAADRYLISRGITSFHDVSYNNDRNTLQLFERYINDGLITSRATLAMGIQGLSDDTSFEGISESAASLRVYGVKIVLHETSGEINLSQQELKRILLDIQRRKQPAIIHAIEEHVVRYAVSALGALPPSLYSRNRIEHCSVCPPGLAEDLAKRGLCVVTHPNFVYYNGDRYLHTVPHAQLPFLYAFKTLSGLGNRLAAGSDCPVAAADPIKGIYSAVTRTTLAGALLNPQEALDIYEAVKMHTLNAAYVMGEDAVKGSLSVGKLADMVLLDADPTAAGQDEIKDINVDMVIMGGEVVYSR